MEQQRLPSFNYYYLDESDPDTVVLCRQDGSFVAAFSASGATKEGIIQAAEEDYLLLKSATPQQLTDAIRKALEGASPVDQEIATQLLLRLLDKPRREEPPSPLVLKQPPGGEHAAAAPPASLSRREVDVVRLIARGHTNSQIARSLFVSVSTVKKHVQRIIAKLRVSDRTQAAVKASGMGLLDDRDGEG